MDKEISFEVAVGSPPERMNIVENNIMHLTFVHSGVVAVGRFKLRID